MEDHQPSNIVTIQNVLNVLASVISKEKQIKVIRIVNKETNGLLCILYGMVVYTEESKTLQIIRTKNPIRLLDKRSVYQKVNYNPIYQPQRLKKYYF